MKQVNIIIGRFQPITMGHIKCAEQAKTKTRCKTVLCMIDTPDNKVDERHPFPSSALLPLYNDLFKNKGLIEDIVLVKNANIVAVGEELYKRGYEIRSWTCGTDRVSSYSRMAAKYSEQAHLAANFELIEVRRTDDDISATAARHALLNDDRITFTKLFPSGSYVNTIRTDVFKYLYDLIQVVKESNEYTHLMSNSKNLQSVNESILLTIALVALCTKPFFDSEFAKSVGSGIGSMFGGIGSLFAAAAKKIGDKKDDKKDDNEAFASMMSVMIERAKKDAPDDTKDLLDKMQGCLRDENGKATDPTQLGDKIAKATGKSIDDIKKSSGLDKVTDKDIDDAQKNLNNDLSKLSPEELKKEVQTANENTQKMAQQAQTGEGEPKEPDPKDPKSDPKDPKSEPKSDPKDPDAGATVSDEDVMDKETGKMVKRKVYTGPQGGRYWYADGAPHDDKHKNYIQESLSHWLGRRLV